MPLVQQAAPGLGIALKIDQSYSGLHLLEESNGQDGPDHHEGRNEKVERDGTVRVPAQKRLQIERA